MSLALAYSSDEDEDLASNANPFGLPAPPAAKKTRVEEAPSQTVPSAAPHVLLEVCTDPKFRRKQLTPSLRIR
jgi:pre-mRNA-processing factor 17